MFKDRVFVPCPRIDSVQPWSINFIVRWERCIGLVRIFWVVRGVRNHMVRVASEEREGDEVIEEKGHERKKPEISRSRGASVNFRGITGSKIGVKNCQFIVAPPKIAAKDIKMAGVVRSRVLLLMLWRGSDFIGDHNERSIIRVE